jgi:hypothetical protein
MGGVGIFFRVAVGVVHPVEYGVGAWVEEGRALGDKSEAIKEFLPKFVHFKHLVGSVAVQEEGLGKKRKEPVTKEKKENSHRVFDKICP